MAGPRDRPAAFPLLRDRRKLGVRILRPHARWDEDCLHLAPDVLSLLIGV